MKRSSKVALALVLSTEMALTACAPTTDSAAAGDTASSVNTGFVCSKTWPLVTYGEAYYEGLPAGPDYAADGTGKVWDTELNITYHYDGAIRTRQSPSSRN